MKEQGGSLVTSSVAGRYPRCYRKVTAFRSVTHWWFRRYSTRCLHCPGFPLCLRARCVGLDCGCLARNFQPLTSFPEAFARNAKPLSDFCFGHLIFVIEDESDEVIFRRGVVVLIFGCARAPVRWLRSAPRVVSLLQAQGQGGRLRSPLRRKGWRPVQWHFPVRERCRANGMRALRAALNQRIASGVCAGDDRSVRAGARATRRCHRLAPAGRKT